MESEVAHLDVPDTAVVSRFFRSEVNRGDLRNDLFVRFLVNAFFLVVRGLAKTSETHLKLPPLQREHLLFRHLFRHRKFLRLRQLQLPRVHELLPLVPVVVCVLVPLVLLSTVPSASDVPVDRNPAGGRVLKGGEDALEEGEETGEEAG
jgi:hypothetical protein